MAHGYCPFCGNELTVPEGLTDFSCLYCSKRLALEQLLDALPDGDCAGDYAEYQRGALHAAVDFPKSVDNLSKPLFFDYFDAYCAECRAPFEALERCAVAAADKEWSVMLLRYFNPVGAHPSGRIGEAPNGIPNNLMPFITQTACGVRKELVVFGDDYPTHDGTCVRDYIHVMDLAEGHAAAIDYLMAHTGTEVFNLGTGQGYSVLDMVKAFEEVNRLALPHRIGPRRPGDIATCYADPRKSQELLHWTAKRTLKDMCADAWHWQQLNPRGYDA